MTALYLVNVIPFRLALRFKLVYGLRSIKNGGSTKIRPFYGVYTIK
jgi:hypothetical protein